MTKHYIHLISDSTGGTLDIITGASLALFDDVNVETHSWPMVRTKNQMLHVIEAIKQQPGLVLYTLVSNELKSLLEKKCSALGVSAVSILDPVVQSMSYLFEKNSSSKPGLQHKMDDEYFKRMDAVEYAFHHDDGREKSDPSLEEADVILIGRHKTSKSPTCFYLANKGIKAANIPYVSEDDFTVSILELQKPLFIGLVAAVEQDKDKQEEAISFYKKQAWPIIDVSSISVEEVAAEIINLLNTGKE